MSHDGITTFTELLDALQNGFNVNYDVAVFLAVFSVSLTGDLITEKVSIGCDATSRTAVLGESLLGREGGLSSHNVSSFHPYSAIRGLSILFCHMQKIEGDASLTRNDFSLSPNGDNYSFNGTLFSMMQETCHGTFDRACLSLYKSQRYAQSRADNSNFFFGPGTLLNYVAASFLYELFPDYGNEGTPNLAIISSFFGAESDGQGGFRFNGGERFPSNWHNRRVAFNLANFASEVLGLYLPHPVLLGGNTSPGSFDTLNFQSIKDGKVPTDPATVICLLYQIATGPTPGMLSLPTDLLSWVLGKLNPIFGNFGCI